MICSLEKDQCYVISRNTGKSGKSHPLSLQRVTPKVLVSSYAKYSRKTRLGLYVSPSVSEPIQQATVSSTPDLLLSFPHQRFHLVQTLMQHSCNTHAIFDSYYVQYTAYMIATSSGMLHENVKLNAPNAVLSPAYRDNIYTDRF